MKKDSMGFDEAMDVLNRHWKENSIAMSKFEIEMAIRNYYVEEDPVTKAYLVLLNRAFDYLKGKGDAK